MSYLQFLLLFLVPPIVVLAVWQRLRAPDASRRAYARMGLIAAIALVYTTPWDNYLIAVGAWTYSPNAVIGTIGLVPIEEYCFFILQPFATGLLMETVRPNASRIRGHPRSVSILGVVIGSAVTVTGILAILTGFSKYLGLILVWSGPVLLLQWAYDGDLLKRTWRKWLGALAISTIYLWIADAIAIKSGVWSISASATVGWHVAGLPIEEMMFFLCTNAMVLFGLVLLEGSPLGRTADGIERGT